MSVGLLHDRTTLTVLPFTGIGNGAAPDYFTRGFAEDLTTDLSRFADWTVVTPSADHKPADSEFMLRGSLRRAGAHLRITAQLVATGSGEILWADRFDRSVEEVFDIQDEITARVVGSVSSRINAALLARARRKPKTQHGTYDLWLQGLDLLKQGSLRADEQARELFHRALATDGSYSRAYLGLSLTHFNEWSCQLWHRWDENECRAFDYAEKAHQLDPDDHYTQVVLGRILLFRREFERAEAHFQRALALNTNDADCLVQLALGLAFLGAAEEGYELYQRAVRINPYHEAWYHGYGAGVAFVLERYETALELGARLPGIIMVDQPAYQAVAHHYLGNSGEALRCVGLYLEEFQAKIAADRDTEPGEALRWLAHVNPFRLERDERRLLDGVRVAGMQGASEFRELSPTPLRRAFRRVGSLWQLSFEGKDSWLPPLKGFSDIQTLIEQAGQELHCAEIMGLAERGSADDAVDVKARRAYQERIGELRIELSEAEAACDLGRQERLRTELDWLGEHLTGALGLGGRARKLGAPQERARAAVTQRIRAAIKKVFEVNEPLGRHLEKAIRTGTFCSYQSEQHMQWEL